MAEWVAVLIIIIIQHNYGMEKEGKGMVPAPSGDYIKCEKDVIEKYSDIHLFLPLFTT